MNFTSFFKVLITMINDFSFFLLNNDEAQNAIKVLKKANYFLSKFKEQKNY